MRNISLNARRDAVIASTCATAFALLAAGCSAPVHTESTEVAHNMQGYDHSMQVVPHSTTFDGAARGWRYFSDSQTPRAVVISPQGDYYYSCGEGLHWVAAQQY